MAVVALQPKTAVDTQFYHVTNQEGLEFMFHELAGVESLELDTETMRSPDLTKPDDFRNIYNFIKKAKADEDPYGAFDPHTSKVRLMQLRSRTSLPFVIDLSALSDKLRRWLARWLVENGAHYKLHNAQFDLKQIASSLGVWLPRVRCSMQMSILLANALGGGKDRGHSLADNARDFLGVNLDKTQQLSDWSRPALTDEQLEYAALDVTRLHDLHDVLEKAIADELLMKEPLELEMAVLPPTARMEYWGIPVDVPMIRKVKTAALKSLPDLKQKVLMSFPKGTMPYTIEYHEGKPYRMPAINLGSKTHEVLPMLREFGLTIEDCQRATLEAFRETIPGLGALVDFYNIEKQSQFDYEKYVHPLTGRIHGRFRPSGASTGRFSSTDPNLQQVPGKVYLAYTCPVSGKVEMVNYRYCFHAEPGWLICSADFSGQELAVMAAISGDEVMMEVLNTGGDLHSEAAAGMFGLDLTENKDAARAPKPGDPTGRTYRDYGKILMFSLAYGKTAEGFAADWGVTVDEAKGYIKGFEKRFPKLAAFLTRMGKVSEQSNYSRILNGAIRFVGGGDTGKTDKGAANRAGKNNQIQGLSSWMTRIAMITLDEFIMQGRISNQWALKGAKLVATKVASDGEGDYDEELAYLLQASVAEGLEPDSLRGLLPMQLVACIHDELLVHFKASPSCPLTAQRMGKHEGFEEAKARAKAAKKAKDKAAEKQAEKDMEDIKDVLKQACACSCPKEYVPGRECVTYFEGIIGRSMQLAGTYYLQNRVPAGYSVETALVWTH